MQPVPTHSHVDVAPAASDVLLLVAVAVVRDSTTGKPKPRSKQG